MKKIRLTESDLTRIVRRVIKEQEEMVISNKIENIVNNPRVENKIEDFLSQLPKDELSSLADTLTELGIDENTSAGEIHSMIGSSDERFEEMTEEEDDDDKSSAKYKIREILHGIGAGNIAAWGGVPLAMVIGSMTGMPIGFAASWGLTGLLMGIAKLMGKKSPESD